MRAWPGARKGSKELPPVSRFWQSFRDHLCFRHSLPHIPGWSACTKPGIPPPACLPQMHPVPHPASLCRTVRRGQKSGQCHAKLASNTAYHITSWSSASVLSHHGTGFFWEWTLIFGFLVHQGDWGYRTGENSSSLLHYPAM